LRGVFQNFPKQTVFYYLIVFMTWKVLLFSGPLRKYSKKRDVYWVK